MCYDEGRFQEYIDNQLDSGEMDKVRVHLQECRECSQIYRKLLENEMVFREHMGLISGMEEQLFDAEVAWQKLKLKMEDSHMQNKRYERRIKMRLFKKVIAAAAAVAVIAVLFSFSPVRSLAAGFLTIFRADRVSVISVSNEDIAGLEKAVRDGAGDIDINNFGRVVVNGKPEMKEATLEEAREAVDFTLSLPDRGVYPGVGLSIMTGSSMNFSLDIEKVNSLLASLGGSKMLPEGLSGREFNVVVPAVVVAQYNGQEGKVVFTQSRGPSIRVSPGEEVNIDEIKEALVSLPVLPDNLKRQLAAVNDWQHTAVIPVPEGQSSEVDVNGSPGVFIGGGSGTQDSCLIWVKSGIIYTVNGNLDQSGALKFAGEVR